MLVGGVCVGGRGVMGRLSVSVCTWRGVCMGRCMVDEIGGVFDKEKIRLTIPVHGQHNAEPHNMPTTYTQTYTQYTHNINII